MKTLAVDLRCLPKDGYEGAGIPQATRGLWHALVEEGPTFDITCKDRRECTAEDALFSPTGVIPWGRRGPTFPWVHDLAIFSHPEWFPESWLRRQYTTRRFLYGLKRARHVFCVSEATKDSLLRLTTIPAEDITVTLEGTDELNSIPSWEKREDAVLILGTVEPRKNIPFILRLWPMIQRETSNKVKLIIAGREGWGNVEIPTQEGIERVTHLSNSERDRLLGRAKLVLVPSLYEGFGRVALEAMAAGTPVIASRVGAHPEVIGDGGKVLELLEKDWKNAIFELLTDEDAWKKQQQKGRSRARLFDWPTVAKRILAVIAQNC